MRRLFVLSTGGAFTWSLCNPNVDRNPSRLSAASWSNWLDACRWIERETPRDSLFLTPRFNFAFKWYAQRAEYVAFKDCPQDGPHLLEWQRRLELLRDWRDRNLTRGFDDRAVEELQLRTGVDYIVAWTNRRYDPYTMPPVYRNDSFAVYRLPEIQNRDVKELD